MEQNQNRFAPEALADESASPEASERSEAAPRSRSDANGRPTGRAASPIDVAGQWSGGAPPKAPAPANAPPDFAEPPLLSSCLDEIMEETLAETFPPDGRKPRHDGWTPEAVGAFLRHLAATGVVEHAARAAGLSAASAYAFRNRRQGRAFAKMWDAMLIHRARARVASELQGRAIAGCVSIRKRDGEVVGEYHYYDNRLAMAMLTRLDRLAEREAPGDAHLRALSEDLDGFVDCLAGGGDADAFVEARAPLEPEPEPKPARLPPDEMPDVTRFALMAGCHHYRDFHPCDIHVLDLDPSRREQWDDDQWVRAFRSGFMLWLDARRIDGNDTTPRPGMPLRYHFTRLASAAAVKQEDAIESGAEEAVPVETADLDIDAILDWDEDQLGRACRSGLMISMPDQFWDDLVAEMAVSGEEE